MDRIVEKEKKSGTTKKIIFIVVGVIAVIVVAFLILVSRMKTLEKKNANLEKAVSVKTVISEAVEEAIPEEEHILTETDLETWLTPASELVTMKYHYRTADIYENYKKVKGVKVPLTTDMFVFSFEGEMTVGIDFSKVSFKIDNEHKLITITLPKAKILSHSVDENTLEFRNAKDSILNKTDFDDYAELMTEQKQKERQRLLADGDFWKKVNENTHKVFEDLLSASEDTKEYAVVFKENGEDNQSETENEE